MFMDSYPFWIFKTKANQMRRCSIFSLKYINLILTELLKTFFKKSFLLNMYLDFGSLPYVFVISNFKK